MPEVPVRVAGRSAVQWAQRVGPAVRDAGAEAPAVARYPLLENERQKIDSASKKKR